MESWRSAVWTPRRFGLATFPEVPVRFGLATFPEALRVRRGPSATLMLGDLFNGEEGRAFALEGSTGDRSRESEFVLLETAFPARITASVADNLLVLAMAFASYPLFVCPTSAPSSLLARDPGRVRISAFFSLFMFSPILALLPSVELSSLPGPLLTETHACDNHCFLANEGNLHSSSSFLHADFFGPGDGGMLCNRDLQGEEGFLRTLAGSSPALSFFFKGV